MTTLKEKAKYDTSSKQDMYLWSLWIKNLRFEAYIGIFPHELELPQPLSVNVKCDYLAPLPEADSPSVEQVVCYEHLTQEIQKIAKKKHTYFIENLAHLIGRLCLSDERVQHVTVGVEKIDCTSLPCFVSVEITLSRSAITDI